MKDRFVGMIGIHVMRLVQWAENSRDLREMVFSRASVSVRALGVYGGR